MTERSKVKAEKAPRKSKKALEAEHQAEFEAVIAQAQTIDQLCAVVGNHEGAFEIDAQGFKGEVDPATVVEVIKEYKEGTMSRVRMLPRYLTQAAAHLVRIQRPVIDLRNAPEVTSDDPKFRVEEIDANLKVITQQMQAVEGNLKDLNETHKTLTLRSDRTLWEAHIDLLNDTLKSYRDLEADYLKQKAALEKKGVAPKADEKDKKVSGPEKKTIVGQLGLTPEQLAELSKLGSLEEVLKYLKDADEKNEDHFMNLGLTIMGLEDLLRLTELRDRKDAIARIDKNVRRSIQPLIDAYVGTVPPAPSPVPAPIPTPTPTPTPAPVPPTPTGSAPGTPPSGPNNITPPPIAAPAPAPANPNATPAPAPTPVPGNPNAAPTPNPVPPTAPQAPQRAPSSDLLTIDNQEKEIADLNAALAKLSPTDPLRKVLTERIVSINSEINAHKGDWAKEEQEAAKELNSARAEYVVEHMKERKSQGGIFKRSFRKIFGLKKEESPTFKLAQEKYNMMQKRYANAVAQGEWEIHRNLGGDIPFGTPEFEALNAKIKARQIQRVMIPEYARLKEVEAETLPPVEKGRFRKMLEAYGGMSRTKRILIGAAITSIPAAFVSGYLFAGTVLRKAVRATLAMTIGAGYAERYGRKKNQELQTEHDEGVEELNDSYNLFGNTQEVADFERATDKKRRKVALKKMGVAALFGGGSSLLIGALDNAFLNPGGASVPETTNKPASGTAPLPAGTVDGTVSAPGTAPSNIDDSSIMDEYVRTHGVPESAPMDPYQQALENNDGIPENHLGVGSEGTYGEDFDRVTAKPDFKPFGDDGTSPKVPSADPIMDEYVRTNGVPESAGGALKRGLDLKPFGYDGTTPKVPSADPIMDEYVRTKGVPVSAGSPTQVSPGVPPTTPVSVEAPGGVPAKTFTDLIEDKMRGARVLKGDSAELSAKRIFEQHAKELGFDESKGISVRKWAEGRVEQLVKDHPEVRGAITHNGNSIKIGFNADGSVSKVEILKGEGLAPRVNGEVIGAPKGSVPESVAKPALEKPTAAPRVAASTEPRITRPSVTPKVPATATAPVTPTTPVNAIPNVAPEVLAKAVGKALPERVAEIFPPKVRFFGPFRLGTESVKGMVNDERWIRVGNVDAGRFLKADMSNVPQFLAQNNLPREITGGQLSAIRELVDVGNRAGVIKPGMTIGNVAKAVIEQEEAGKLAATAVKK
ncbi:MAG: hypothetical protein RLY57_609 [Candidatus Parcubacteria bacterium]|jgi:hypothetical protein